MNETKLIFDFLRSDVKQIYFDIGAHSGKNCIHAVKNNWEVHCFEPNPDISKDLVEFSQKNKQCYFNNVAISSILKGYCDFFISQQSTGISSLNKFHSSHFLHSSKVKCIALKDYIRDLHINTIDFLKIDAEGHDFFVLKSHDWSVKPRVIEVEFEDLKTSETTHLGENPLKPYTYKDMYKYLTDLGYKIIISEWSPILKYGGGGTNWNKFSLSNSLSNEKCWGNFLCFLNDKDYDHFLKLNHL